ncbi:MAG: toll/interleukin-1 receptor domain-containing protein, partial [Synergistaceae bacterium]|nr:toll/interleukin-1 receptor domain-containing protein [Synergistaceae bacterium]
ANHFRRQNEFDRALAAYESILDEDNSNAEAHWGAVLCRFGIEYVEDPATHRRVPTCHRVQYESILDHPDCLAALEHAPDGYSRSLYEEEAKTISEIQKGILAISRKEEPFDVFICYKEAEDNGDRTKDSVIAQDVYYRLTQAGYKVFFSRITLEDKLGSEYEPYIFSALNSARVMIVIGTSPARFSAVWVKNEWSRYLALMKKDRSRLLIPCYQDMDPYDLPDELSHLQAQDMSKIGFVQDLIRGIQKVLSADKSQPETAPQAAATAARPDVKPLLERAYIFLEDGEFARADNYFERVLDIDPQCAAAYMGKYQAKHQCQYDIVTDEWVRFMEKVTFLLEQAPDSACKIVSLTLDEASQADVKALQKSTTLTEQEKWKLIYFDNSYIPMMWGFNEAMKDFDFPDADPNYQRALRFADESNKTIYAAYPREIREKIEEYRLQLEQMDRKTEIGLQKEYEEYMSSVITELKQLDAKRLHKYGICVWLILGPIFFFILRFVGYPAWAVGALIFSWSIALINIFFVPSKKSGTDSKPEEQMKQDDIE